MKVVYKKNPKESIKKLYGMGLEIPQNSRLIYKNQLCFYVLANNK